MKLKTQLKKPKKKHPQIKQVKNQIKKNSFGIFCLGCAQNRVDAKLISSLLVQRGYQFFNCNQANLIIILSCSVRQSAIDRIWGKLQNWIKANKKVFIIGCVLKNDKQKLHAKYPKLIILSTPDFLKELPKLPIFSKPNLKKLPFRKWKNGYLVKNNKRNRRKYPRNHAFVPIQYGCDNFCAYCAVPLTRGREKSRPAKEIIKQIKNLIAEGKNYITLIGQNVNSYGLTRQQKLKNIRTLRLLVKNKNILTQEEKQFQDSGKITFDKLLKQLEKISGLEKLDFLSPNPQDMTDEVIDWMARSRKFTQNLHLPIQSGSDKILKKMNRRYTAKQYLKLVKKIKKVLPQITLSTDVIVGFPSETKKDFERTYNLCREIGFKQIYIGKYSPRSGTVAEKFFKDNISWLEKKKRWKKLSQLTNQLPNR